MSFIENALTVHSQQVALTDATTPTQKLTVTAAGAAKTDGSAVTQPISAASLPLPAGAATEATLSTRLAEATFTGRINTQGQKAMAASTPVVIASDQSAVPISVASLPLPAGASTLAEQQTQTTALQKIDNIAHAGSDVVLVEHVPISGQLDDVAPTAVTENQIAPVRITSGRALHVAQQGAIPAGTNNIGDVDVLTLPALVAGTANIGDVDVLTLPALVAGTANIGDVDVLTLPALVTGSATIGAVTGPTADNAANPTLKLSVLPGVALAAAPTRTEGNVNPLRLNLAGDAAITLDGEAVVLGTGAATIGALMANQSVNEAQINGVAPLMGNGVTGTGSQRVTVASDNTAFPVNATLSAETTKVIGTVRAQGNLGAAFDAATAAAVPANAVLSGRRAATANPTAVTDAQHVAAMTDKLGRQVVVPGHVRDLVIQSRTTDTTGGEVTILAAGAVGVFHDLTSIVFANVSATGVQVDIRDTTGGSIVTSFYVPATQTAGAVFSTPFKQTTAATNWTMDASSAITTLICTVQAVKNL